MNYGTRWVNPGCTQFEPEEGLEARDPAGGRWGQWWSREPLLWPLRIQQGFIQNSRGPRRPWGRSQFESGQGLGKKAGSVCRLLS